MNQSRHLGCKSLRLAGETAIILPREIVRADVEHGPQRMFMSQLRPPAADR